MIPVDALDTATTFLEIDPSPLTDELGRVVSELEHLVREADAAQ